MSPTATLLEDRHAPVRRSVRFVRGAKGRELVVERRHRSSDRVLEDGRRLLEFPPNIHIRLIGRYA